MHKLLQVILVNGGIAASAAAEDAAPPKGEVADLGDGVALEMVLVPAGKFIMGPEISRPQNKDAGFRHEVTLTKPFYMGKFEVTQEQWQAVMGENPAQTKGPRLPATHVSWDDCQIFIKKLNEKTKGGYRLPTEAEWEYACRAGTQTAFFVGDTITRADGNFGEENAGKAEPAGSYKPNSFGLYDLHGNVWEWCQDWLGPYAEGPVSDPTGPETGEFRILRGGCFYDKPFGGVNSAFRYEFEPIHGTIYFGFRLVREIP